MLRLNGVLFFLPVSVGCKPVQPLPILILELPDIWTIFLVAYREVLFYWVNCPLLFSEICYLPYVIRAFHSLCRFLVHLTTFGVSQNSSIKLFFFYPPVCSQLQFSESSFRMFNDLLLLVMDVSALVSTTYVITGRMQVS